MNFFEYFRCFQFVLPIGMVEYWKIGLKRYYSARRYANERYG
jgi:hypothetical protein